MSEPENFFARWSRRKAEAEQTADRADDANQRDELQQQPGGAAAEAKDEQAKKEGDEVDLSKLPPIESIGPETDIRAFLQKGIPPELTRAALRRVWTSDPAIRNFIGIAENQYDFATGSDIPGFGPLTPADDVARMVREIMREGVPRPPPPSEPEPSSEADAETLEKSTKTAEVADESSASNQVAALNDVPAENDAAQQNEVGEEQDEASPAPPSHGGALPR
jgi:hypothetical protein